MNAGKLKHLKGASLAEVMVTIALVLMTVFGVSQYRYHATLDAKKARLHANAGRIALLVCEGWAGATDTTTYDPVANLASVLKIEPIFNSGQSPPTGFNMLGQCGIFMEDVRYNASLHWRDISAKMRALNVAVEWAPLGRGDMKQPSQFRLTTYVPI
ncbi:MAG: hypothetical protein ACYTEL_13815 [Planctomycetota bacterium]|jgi:hypothetical protein